MATKKENILDRYETPPEFWDAPIETIIGGFKTKPSLTEEELLQEGYEKDYGKIDKEWSIKEKLLGENLDYSEYDKRKYLEAMSKLMEQGPSRGGTASGQRVMKDMGKSHKKLMKIKEEEKRLAKEEAERLKNLSMWQRMGKHFGENADKRDQLFSMLGSIGKEMVKPIEPGKEAAGALLPTLSRGLGKGEEEWAAKEAAATKRMVDLASARADINPLQYYSNAMKEARLMVPEGTDPDSAEGLAWIGNHLRSIGIPSQVVDLGNSITEQQILLTQAPEDQRDLIQKNINEMLIQQNTLLSQMMGGGSTGSGNVPYLGG